MQIRNKIGFHLGSNSTATGWGEHVRSLDAAGIPAVVMSVAGEGFGDIEACWDRGSQVDHVAIIRCLSHDDVPLYDTDITFAVNEWLNRYVPTIGNDVRQYHQRVITKHGNELNKEKIQWLAQFYEALHPALLQRMGWTSHRICVFNFSGGEPEYDDWESILPFLELAGNNPDKFVIGVHEYSFDETDILADPYYFVGRCVSHLYDVCDNNEIKRPKVAIHEFGWRDKKIPSTTAQAMADIDRAMTYYAANMGDDLIGAGVWTLQPWQDSGINLEVQKLIKPMTKLTLEKLYDAPDEVVVPPPVENGRKVTVLLTPQMRTLSADEKAKVYGYQQNGFPLANGTFTSGEHTMSPSHDDAFELYLAGKAGSNLGIVYPQKSGYTREWILANYPQVFDPAKVVTFLEGTAVPPPATIPDLKRGDVVVDISYAQGNIDLQSLWSKGKVKRFIIRATSGKAYNSTDEFGVDIQFWNNVTKAVAIGAPVECYMFFNKDEPYQEQVTRFKDTVQTAVSRGLIVAGVAADFEGEYSPQTEVDLRRACQIFKDTMSSVSNNLVVYSGAWWWNPRVPAAATWPKTMGLQQWAAYYVPGDPLTVFPPVNYNFTKLNGFAVTRYWQFTSKGGLLVGYPTKNLDLNYYLKTDVVIEPPAPPAVKKINVLPYLKAVDRVQFDQAYSGGTQTTQVRHYPTRWIYVKGENPGQYECFFVGTHNGSLWIFRAEDTSESPTRLYAHYMSNGGAIGAPWIPVEMEVGKWYETSKFVQHYNKSLTNGVWNGGCSPANSGNVVDKIKLVAEPYNRVYRSGKTLKVITLQWSSGEQYDYCLDFGNVGFRDATREFWFMEGPLLGRQDKKYIKPACVNTGW